MNGAIKSWKDTLRRSPVVGVILRAIEKSNQDHAKDMAASMAYFSFFSLFPLLVGVVAGASLFLDGATIESRLDRLLAGEFPGSADFLRTNLDALIKLRGVAGVASVVGLLWSASKMFGALSRGINVALAVPKEHAFYLSKLRYFAMTVVVSVLLSVAVGASTAFASLGSHVASFLCVSMMVSLLYFSARVRLFGTEIIAARREAMHERC